MSARGWAIVELLVALAIGLMVTLLASSLLLATSQSYREQEAAAAVADSGSFALDALARAIRTAGLADWDGFMDDAGDGPVPVAGLDARALSASAPALEHPLSDAVNGSDVLALRFAGANDGSVLNCAGFEVADAAHGWSIFYVARAADGETELRCKYRGSSSWSAAAVVRGVDSFQVLYGVDTDAPPDGLPDRYLTASQVTDLDAALVLQGATVAERAQELNRKTHWKRIRVIRIGLLLHGNAQQEQRDLRSFGLLGADYANSGDTGARIDEAALPSPLRLRERQQFSANVTLRNGTL